MKKRKKKKFAFLVEHFMTCFVKDALKRCEYLKRRYKLHGTPNTMSSHRLIFQRMHTHTHTPLSVLQKCRMSL